MTSSFYSSRPLLDPEDSSGNYEMTSSNTTHNIQVAVILICTEWINGTLINQLEKNGAVPFLVSFGLDARRIKNIKKRYPKYAFFNYDREAFFSRDYVKILLKILRKINKKSFDYCLCLHGDSAVIGSIDEQITKIRQSPDQNLIEQFKPDGRHDVKHFFDYYFGKKFIDSTMNSILHSFPGRRFRSVGFRYGHAAWGMSKKALEYILSSELSKYMYRLCRFSRFSKNYFFHTVIYHSSTPTIEESPEHYVSKDFVNYTMAYRDHALALLRLNKPLFYPTSPYAKHFSRSTDKYKGYPSHTPFREFSHSRPPLFFNWTDHHGPLSRVNRPFFCLIFFPGMKIDNLVNMLNQYDDIVCHGSINRKECVDYKQQSHICPRYPKNDPASRDFRINTFVYDLIYHYANSFFGFAMSVWEKRCNFQKIWTLPGCQAIFILPNAVYSHHQLMLEPKGNSNSLRVEINLSQEHLYLISHQRILRHIPQFMRMLSVDNFSNNTPMIIPEHNLIDPFKLEETAKAIHERLLEMGLK